MKLWKKYFLFCELALSIVIMLLAVILVNHFKTENIIMLSLNNIRLQIYSTIAGVTGALLGFVITGLSILLATNESDSIQILKQSPYYKQVFAVFTSTSKWLAFTTIISIIALLVDRDSFPQLWFTWLVAWGAIISIIRLLRSFWVLDKMIKIIIK